ncbi:YaaL family protein [Levilactobacillus bambusae]|uniref:DUF2508 domain-containing protein n=1 Tax=Levilactobacillus bambusae TaxID=2024736 RepID=A0A2V1MWY4_9LACO|nr:YaaL family protein [Levilactobacillus bambusae]PWF99391.1 DUF2508 domain-containing protein [Levilactobacillus bambusae]
MFGRNREAKLRREYDDMLIDAIDNVKMEWDQAKQTENAIADHDAQILAQTLLQRDKYLYLYREARRRHAHGDHIQSSVYSS